MISSNKTLSDPEESPDRSKAAKLLTFGDKSSPQNPGKDMPAKARDGEGGEEEQAEMSSSKAQFLQLFGETLFKALDTHTDFVKTVGTILALDDTDSAIRQLKLANQSLSIQQEAINSFKTNSTLVKALANKLESKESPPQQLSAQDLVASQFESLEQASEKETSLRDTLQDLLSKCVVGLRAPIELATAINEYVLTESKRLSYDELSVSFVGKVQDLLKDIDPVTKRQARETEKLLHQKLKIFEQEDVYDKEEVDYFKSIGPLYAKLDENQISEEKFEYGFSMLFCTTVCAGCNKMFVGEPALQKHLHDCDHHLKDRLIKPNYPTLNLPRVEQLNEFLTSTFQPYCFLEKDEKYNQFTHDSYLHYLFKLLTMHAADLPKMGLQKQHLKNDLCLLLAQENEQVAKQLDYSPAEGISLGKVNQVDLVKALDIEESQDPTLEGVKIVIANLKELNTVVGFQSSSNRPSIISYKPFHSPTKTEWIHLLEGAADWWKGREAQAIPKCSHDYAFNNYLFVEANEHQTTDIKTLGLEVFDVSTQEARELSNGKIEVREKMMESLQEAIAAEHHLHYILKPKVKKEIDGSLYLLYSGVGRPLTTLLQMNAIQMLEMVPSGNLDELWLPQLGTVLLQTHRLALHGFCTNALSPTRIWTLQGFHEGFLFAPNITFGKQDVGECDAVYYGQEERTSKPEDEMYAALILYIQMRMMALDKSNEFHLHFTPGTSRASSPKLLLKSFLKDEGISSWLDHSEQKAISTAVASQNGSLNGFALLLDAMAIRQKPFYEFGLSVDIRKTVSFQMREDFTGIFNTITGEEVKEAIVQQLELPVKRNKTTTRWGTKKRKKVFNKKEL